MTKRQAMQIIGGLGKPSKMPGFSYGLPAKACKVGQRLASKPGTVCSGCYADGRGNYRFKGVQDAQARRLASLKHPLWVDAFAYVLQVEDVLHFRWHDSGDLQGRWHLRNIVEVCRRTPLTRHWLPTRETRIVSETLELIDDLPENLTIRLSAHIVDGKTPDALAARLGVTVSGVTTDENHPLICPAPTQENSCQLCRKCWDRDTFAVHYLKH